MTVSKELNQVLTCSSERSLTSLQIALEAIVVTGNLENLNLLYKMSSSEEEGVLYRYHYCVCHLLKLLKVYTADEEVYERTLEACICDWNRAQVLFSESMNKIWSNGTRQSYFEQVMQNDLFNLQKFIEIPVINTIYHNFQCKYQCSTRSIQVSPPL